MEVDGKCQKLWFTIQGEKWREHARTDNERIGLLQLKGSRTTWAHRSEVTGLCFLRWEAFLKADLRLASNKEFYALFCFAVLGIKPRA